jgi:predicted PurR-regulated permease PerM
LDGKKKTPKGLAVVICLLTLVLGLTSIVALLGWKIYDLLDDFAMVKKVSMHTFSNIQVYIYNHLNLTYKEQFQILKSEQPSYGNITGTAVTLVVSALYGADLSMLGGIVLVYVVIQMFQGWVLEPLILGPQVKINPLFTIFALVLGELIWEISGIILAIPMIAIFKIICDHITSLKPYGFLIGEIETERKESVFIKKIRGKQA